MAYLIYLLGVLLLLFGAYYAFNSFSRLPPRHRNPIIINVLCYPIAYIAIKLFFPDAWEYTWVFVGLVLVLLVTYVVHRSGHEKPE